MLSLDVTDSHIGIWFLITGVAAEPFRPLDIAALVLVCTGFCLYSGADRLFHRDVHTKPPFASSRASRMYALPVRRRAYSDPSHDSEPAHSYYDSVPVEGLVAAISSGQLSREPSIVMAFTSNMGAVSPSTPKEIVMDGTSMQRRRSHASLGEEEDCMSASI